MKSQKMNIIVFGIFLLKLQISVSEPEFPPHMDLQKVGETIFNNEKFNILKPTTHRVTDHFKDYMLRTESSYHPAKRIFIDHNGFRHDWSGFGEKTKSLRKTDLKHIRGSFETDSEKNTLESDMISKDINNNTVTDEGISDNNVSSNENESNNQEEENNASDNDTVQNVTEESTEASESKETTTFMNLFPPIQKKNNSNDKITIEERLRQGKDGPKAKPEKDKPKDGPKAKPEKDKPKDGPKAKPEKDKPKDGKPDVEKPKVKKETKKEKTVATTTFFCPYFGTITMSAFID